MFEKQSNKRVERERVVEVTEFPNKLIFWNNLEDSHVGIVQIEANVRLPNPSLR